MQPLISVVTASWNQGKFLPACVESVLAEEEGLVEHIIVDNCSDDETPEVIARFPHLRALVEKDGGQSEALNKGFAMARGKWILWLNADDFLQPGSMQRFIDEVRRRPSLDALYGHMVFVDDNGDPIRTLYQAQWRYYMLQFGRLGLPSTGTLYRASLLKENPLGLDYHMIMDTEWTLRNGRGMKVRRLNVPTVAFRVTDDNKTSASIREGSLTPRHAEERKRVAKQYPFYGSAEENAFGAIGNFLLGLARKGIRIRLLADKLFCRLTNRSS